MRTLDSDLVIGGFRRDPEDWVDRRWVAVHQMTPAERRIAIATTADAHALSVLGRYVIVPGVTSLEDGARVEGLDALAAGLGMIGEGWRRRGLTTVPSDERRDHDGDR